MVWILRRYAWGPVIGMLEARREKIAGEFKEGERLKAEFSKEPHSRGAVSMARTNDPDSARSQFFICFKDSNFLDGQYTVWGKVTSGMEFVDMIKKGAPGSGAVNPPAYRMLRVQVAADAKD